MKSAENDLGEKAHQDATKPHLDSMYRRMQQQEQKIAGLERDINTRFNQEANHRETVKNQLTDSLKTSLEKVATVNVRSTSREAIATMPALTLDKAVYRNNSNG